MSDNREPKAGEWVIVSSVEEGDVACLRVEHIGCDPDHRPKAWLSDGTTWLADTGEPLMRTWKGHSIRQATEGELRAKIRETVERVALDYDHETMAEVYGFLLEALR